jgi:hypothetical protein
MAAGDKTLSVIVNRIVTRCRQFPYGVRIEFFPFFKIAPGIYPAMNSPIIWRRSATFFFALILFAPPTFAGDTALNDNARFLAGMNVAQGSALEPLTKAKTYAGHSSFLNRAWTGLDSNQLSRVRAWSTENLKKTQPSLFYMFSGPDYLYADAFFPQATTYVMAGLEAPGDIPDMTKLPRSSVPQELAALRTSLRSVFSYSFFITKEMKRHLYGRRLTGTLPVLFVFLARSGKSIESVNYVYLDEDGTAHSAETAVQAEVKHDTVGVKITFSGDDKRLQTLYYFKTDLSNQGTEHSGFLKFCEQAGGGDSLIKSASYLLHSGEFSHVRDFLLEHSATIVQDDTGVPLNKFDMKEWNVEPFGNYVRPISLFQRNYQPDLRGFFSKRRPHPLHFSFGYQWRGGKSMVLLARRETARNYAKNKPLVQPANLDEVSRK